MSFVVLEAKPDSPLSQQVYKDAESRSAALCSDCELSFLGEGHYSYVFRVSNGRDKFYILKLYKEGAEFRTNLDAAALSDLKSLSDRNMLGDFKVVELAQPPADAALVLRNEYGVTLSHYLQTRRRSKSARDALFKKYKDSLRLYRKGVLSWAREEGYSVEVKPYRFYLGAYETPGLHIELKRGVGNETETRKFFIKPDNVLVSVSGEMTIIDPF